MKTNPNDWVSNIAVGNCQNPPLTKREYFAAMFMAGTIANPEGMAYLSSAHGSDLDTPFKRIASKSVKLADALIEELNKV
jgi:hypothetical protein